MAFGAFHEATAFEAGSGADEGDEVGCVHGPPPLSGGLDELEDHGECGGAGAGASGDLGPQADGGERGLDRIHGPQLIFGDLRHHGRIPEETSCARRLGVDAPVVHPRGLHLDRPGRGGDLPGLTVAVADHKPTAALIALIGQLERDRGSCLTGPQDSAY